VNSDGTPHVMPLGAMWVNGAFYFNTSGCTRKGVNLARNPTLRMDGGNPRVRSGN
jgi:hypothetical protein